MSFDPLGISLPSGSLIVLRVLAVTASPTLADLVSRLFSNFASSTGAAAWAGVAAWAGPWGWAGFEVHNRRSAQPATIADDLLWEIVTDSSFRVVGVGAATQ